jgi:type II secretory pathway pseudopilin PulG
MRQAAKHARADSGTAGFGVVEVLAALSVFAIVASGLAANSVAATRANRVSREISVAAALAQDKMEALRSLDPAANPPDLTAGNHVDPNNPLTAFGGAGGFFTRSWMVTRNAPSLGLSTVVVTVSWGDGGSRTTHVVGYVCPSRECV